MLSCISMNNQECKVRPQIANFNGYDPVFFPYSIKTSKRSGGCNNINNLLAKLCVPDVVKNLKLKCSIQYQEIMKQDAQNGMKRVSVNVDLTLVFLIINNSGMIINAGVNATN